jgi:hypothetical protein
LKGWKMHKSTVPEIDLLWKYYIIAIAVLWLSLGVYAFIVFNF